MFVSWIPQIVSALNFYHECYLDTLFLRIAYAYPAAVYNPFHLSLEQYKSNLAVDHQTNRRFVSNVLAIIQNPLAEKFNEAMKHLCVPQLKLTYHLFDLLKCVQDDRRLKTNEKNWIKSIKLIEDTVYERRRQIISDAKQFGQLFNDIDGVENRIKNLKSLDGGFSFFFHFLS